jgi:hypothetical protein
MAVLVMTKVSWKLPGSSLRTWSNLLDFGLDYTA